ncbi:site-specific DNA-methyltransferase [Gordonia sp. PP30]|uniref:site-specific DNA-methyltransferase n=1 Tax=Gordonia sp. PP30 TaxID=2935861 RepID=UPI001FFE45C4|nr:site-specific DNA-methyltransferase [Gordonia sp. PP30]UQE74738.1 site-specific DNA-methyltransferase [Gordonia sp. PP30]
MFPNAATETRDPDGTVRRAIDFDLLRQELSDHVVEGPQERFHLDWPGKRAAAFAANAPIAKTLRPVREQSVNFDTTKNLVIEGDNLDALKLLQESYLGKVKLIYIDPPYNTGGDFIYDDDFAESVDVYLERSGQKDDAGARLVMNSDTNGRYHSDWLSMMYPRLKLARNLLKDDGAIFVSIDDHEFANLRALCDEVFGAQNFVATIIWQKVFSPKNSAQWFSEDHDYILVYARDKQHWSPNPLPRTAEMDARYKNPDSDARGPWTSSDLAARNFYAAGTYPVTTPSGRLIDGPPRGSYWRVSEASFKALDADNRIWWGADGANMPRLKRFLSEVSTGRTPQTFWPYSEVGHTQDAKKTLLRYVPFEHTENVLNSVKPVQLIRRILHLATSPDNEDIVLDFFSGSGSTAHAVLAQNADDAGNRRFIAVQVHEPLRTPEPEFDSILGMSMTRLRNVAAEIGEQSETDGRGDLGYRMTKVDTSNLADTLRPAEALGQLDLGALESSIKPGRTSEDLLFQVLLAAGLPLTLPIQIEHRDGFDIFNVEDGILVMAIRNDQRSTINDQRSTINDQRSTINDQRSTINDQRSTINDQRSTIKFTPIYTQNRVDLAASRRVSRRRLRVRCGADQYRADLPGAVPGH